MPNTSATGGYLQPTSSILLEGAELEDFLHDWIVGLTGLDTHLVRPRLQPEPPNIPPAATVWAAFGIEDESSDTYPAIVHYGDGDGHDEFRSNEAFDCLVSFYGLGQGSDARAVAKLFRDNSKIGQNREVLFNAGMAIVEVLQPIPVPSLLKERWLYRLDVRARMRRAVVREYPVLNILSAEAELDIQGTGFIQRDIKVEP